MAHQTYKKDGLQIDHFPGMNNEISYIHTEIFKNNDYLPTYLKLREQPCIIDIGANIGLFSLYACQQFPKLELYAIEPGPEVAVFLKTNLGRIKQASQEIHYIQAAVSNKSGIQDFCSYPNLPANSTLDPEFKEEELKHIDHLLSFNHIWGFNKALAALYLLSYPLKLIYKPWVKQYVKKLLSSKKITSTTVITLSELITLNQISAIDLLKIDVEGHELRVLEGIEQQHWAHIHNIALEASGIKFPPSNNPIIDILTSKGYTIKMKFPENNSNALIYMIYAFR